MEMRFMDNGVVQMDDVKIIYRNFAGRGDKFNREGDRNFAVVIEDLEMYEELKADVNRFGVSWNVKKRDPREEGDTPFMYLPVKVRFFGDRRDPIIYLKTGNNMNRLDEDAVKCLDDVDIDRVDLDIRPYDDQINGKPYRAAYLHSICVHQKFDRFAERYNIED